MVIKVSVAGFEELRLQVAPQVLFKHRPEVSVAGFEELRLQALSGENVEQTETRSFSCWV